MEPEEKPCPTEQNLLGIYYVRIDSQNIRIDPPDQHLKDFSQALLFMRARMHIEYFTPENVYQRVCSNIEKHLVADGFDSAFYGACIRAAGEAGHDDGRQFFWETAQAFREKMLKNEIRLGPKTAVPASIPQSIGPARHSAPPSHYVGPPVRATNSRTINPTGCANPPVNPKPNQRALFIQRLDGLTRNAVEGYLRQWGEIKDLWWPDGAGFLKVTYSTVVANRVIDAYNKNRGYLEIQGRPIRVSNPRSK